MDKTHNISLGGFAFLIDDAAYKILNQYLRNIRLSLNKSTGIDEIIADVEYRMAELLRERMNAREVVNQTDVDYLIGVMGRPEDFYTDEFLDDEVGAEDNAYKTNYGFQKRKKLFRDPDDKMLGGVCAGLGHYFGIDTVWIRLILILLPFLDFMFLGVSTGSVFLFYIILWIVVPEAKSTSDKLQMRGEPVNFDSIKDFFGNSPEIVRDNINDFNTDARRVVKHSGSALGTLFHILLKIIGAFFIGILLIVALCLLIAFVATLFGFGVAGLGLGISGIALSDQLTYLFEYNWEKIFAFICLGLVMIISSIALILVSMRLISKRYRVPRYIGFSLPFAWLMGVIGLIIMASTTLSQFKRSEKEVRTVNIPSEADTLILARSGDGSSFNNLEELFDVKEGFLAIPIDNDIQVKPSLTGNSYIEFTYTSKGKTKNNANDNIQQIKYNYAVQDSLIRLDDYLYIQEGNKWRFQNVETVLYLAKDKMVNFRNFDDIEVSQQGNNKWFTANPENIYKFDNDLFNCINCPEEAIDVIEENNTASGDGVITIIDGEDSIIIKTNQNDTSIYNISNGNDSISD